MTFESVVNHMFSGLGVPIPEIILILVGLATIILYAKSFRVGLISHMLSFGLCFIGFYFAGWDTTKPLILTFVFLVLITLSLFQSYSKTSAVV